MKGFQTLFQAFGKVLSGRVCRDPLVRRSVKLVLDALAAGLAMYAAAFLMHQRAPQVASLAAFLVLAMAVNVGFKFYAQHYRVLGIEEARSLLVGSGVLGATAMSVCLLRKAGWPGGESPDVVLGGSLLTGPLWFGLRMSSAILHQKRGSPSAGFQESTPFRRTLIVGAGRAGILLCQALREHSRKTCVVLGFVDDALEKQGVRIHGVPVLGPTLLLPVYIREQRATQVILSMAGISGARLRELAEMARKEGVEVKTVPGIQDMVGDRQWKPEVREIAIEDLLRREPILLDTAGIRAAVEGAVVLITGGGGSIGSELARRVADLKPGRLVLLGRGEHSLWLAQRELAHLFPRQKVDIALCDILNPVRIDQVFRALRPDVVLHAAAHKHVPYLEVNPEEAIGNNIFGTRNVLEAVLAWDVRTLVNVSTDKAVNPVNVLGVSKRIGELIIANEAASVGPGVRLISVRFGNVLGSRGSVIPIFKEQIARGGPVTVTDPDMMRYFMTIPEAAQLVLQAGLLGGNGKVFVLDMGNPVQILELAREMVRLSGYAPGVDMDIRISGVRPGEKLYEELFNPGEERETLVHPKVLEAVQEPGDPALLRRSLRTLEEIIHNPGETSHREILDCFMQLVPTYRPSPTGLGRWLAGGPVEDRVAWGRAGLAVAPDLPRRVHGDVVEDVDPGAVLDAGDDDSGGHGLGRRLPSRGHGGTFAAASHALRSLEDPRYKSGSTRAPMRFGKIP